ncbi:MAG: hypothetical protein JWL70_2654 [Acidimicrobiia bacterium]|nr:hypothetical protein [Acidimicrobiia bacterium]
MPEQAAAGAEKKATADDKPDPIPPPAEFDATRWTLASAEVRKTAKWVITTAGAAAAVVFGAGPIVTKGELTGQYVPQRVAIILLADTIGVIGIVVLIAKTAKVLLPYETSLNNLPTSLAQKIREHPDSYLPDRLPTIESFRSELMIRRRQKREIDALLAGKEESVRALEAIANPNAQQQAHCQAARDELAALTEGVWIVTDNLAVYENCRSTILGEAGYTTVRDLFTGSGTALMAAGLAAALGATVYLLAVSYKPTEPSASAKPAAPAPRLGLLTKRADGISDSLWAAARLGACETPAGTAGPASVPVLVEAGKGSPEDPYVVQTLSLQPACQSSRFNVIDQVAQIHFPTATEVAICYRTSVPATTAGASSSVSSPCASK